MTEESTTCALYGMGNCYLQQEKVVLVKAHLLPPFVKIPASFINLDFFQGSEVVATAMTTQL